MMKYGKTDKPVTEQFDLDKWEDELIELVYENMLRRIHLVTVEERKEHEQID